MYKYTREIKYYKFAKLENIKKSKKNKNLGQIFLYSNSIMNYEGTNFKKIYFKNYIATRLNNKGVEKKDLKSVLPEEDWNSDDFDFSQPLIKNKNTNKGYAVPTGKKNNITVLDFDTMALYHQACDIVKAKDLHKCYTVETRRGMHVYFLYEECVTGQKIKDVDVQNNGKFVIGPETLLKRYTGPPYLYQCLGGKLKRMPQELMDWACKTKDVTKQQRNYESNINYNYEVTDDECRAILDQIADKHREFFDTYSNWLTFTSIMKSLNKQEMWDEYSHLYNDGNYDRYGNMKCWKGLKTKISINYFCKLINIPAMKYHKKVPKDELYNEIDYFEETTEYVHQKFIKVTYEGFMSNNTVIVESGTGSGKITCIKENEERTTILTIVNLISLVNQ